MAGMSRKLPKRTGKDSKQRRMAASKNSSTRRKERHALDNEFRFNSNEELLKSAISRGAIVRYPHTETGRRKVLTELRNARECTCSRDNCN